jgi:hypothetical protein
VVPAKVVDEPTAARSLDDLQDLAGEEAALLFDEQVVAHLPRPLHRALCVERYSPEAGAL